jgi:quinoprotein glucose dehydrogenase
MTRFAGSPRARIEPRGRPHALSLCLAALALGAAAATAAQSPEASDWGYYGGDMFGQRYSSLDQINRANVRRLTVAWTYRTGELGASSGASTPASIVPAATPRAARAA